jgi:hypothetical protein
MATGPPKIPDAPPDDLPERYEWAGYEWRGRGKGAPAVGYLAKDLQAKGKEPSWQILKKLGGKWQSNRFLKNNPTNKAFAERKLADYEKRRHPLPTTEQTINEAGRIKRKRQDKLSRKFAAERAALKAAKPPPKSRLALSPMPLSFAPSTPTKLRAPSSVTMTTPVRPRPFVGASASATDPRLGSSAADVDDEKDVSGDSIANREARARARIDDSLRRGVAAKTLRHRRTVGLPRPIKQNFEAAGAPFVTDRYTAKPTGFTQGMGPKSSRLWRQNENEKAKSRWRMMMGWGSEIGPTRKRIY